MLTLLAQILRLPPPPGHVRGFRLDSPRSPRGCPLAQRVLIYLKPSVPIYLKPRTSRESGICLVRRPVSESSIRNAPPVSNISSTSANVPTSRP